MDIQSGLKAEKKTLNRFTLTDILVYLKKYFPAIILCVLFGLGLGLAAQVYLGGTEIEPTYSAMSSMLVTSKPSYDIAYGEPIYSDPSDLSMASSIIPTVTYLIKTNRVISLLTERLDQDYLHVDIDSIKNSIKLTNAENTPIIEVTLFWPDEAECVAILNALMDVLPIAMLETINIGSVTVIDKAVEAEPRYTLPIFYIITGAVFGLIAGIFIALLAGILSPKVQNQKDIKSLLKLDTIAELPLTRKRSDMLLSDEDLPVEFVEACAIMASIFQFTAEKRGIKSVYITSSVSGEGKTTISINLALALSQKKKRVVLIDADIHRPMISGLLKIPDNIPAIQDILNGTAPVSEALFYINDYILALRTRDDGAEISATELKALISVINKYTDFIIVDTPPVGLVSNALSLNASVDGAIFVIKQDYANIGLVADSINFIRDSGAELIGCVLNGSRYTAGSKRYKKGRYYIDYYKKSGGYYHRGHYYRRRSVMSAQAQSDETKIKPDTHQIHADEIAEAVNSLHISKRM